MSTPERSTRGAPVGGLVALALLGGVLAGGTPIVSADGLAVEHGSAAAAGPASADAVYDATGPIARLGAVDSASAVASRVPARVGSRQAAVAGENGSATEPETDNTVTHVSVRQNGSARWRVTVRTRLPTDESVEKYEAFQERFRANRSAYLADFRDPMARIVTEAANATDREMAATNFTARTSVRSVPRRWGIVTYAFNWDGFARTDGDRLHVGDAFEAGFFIAPNDTLRLHAPEGYELTTLDPPPDEQTDGTATWIGRVDFGTGEPAATVVPAGSAGDGGSGGSDDAPAGDDAPASDGPSTEQAADNGGLLVPGLVLVGSLVLVGGAVGWYRRQGGDAAPDGHHGPGTADPPRATPGAPAEGDDGPAGEATDVPEAEELLPDDERVRQIVDSHGGRMKQADIVEQVEWSKSKVSRVLGDLAEDGVVEKTRIGRENVISLVEGPVEESGED